MRYFSIGELSRSNVADRAGISNSPNTFQRMNLEKLIDRVLDPVRARIGEPIYVNSGFRSGKLNELIGGSKTSDHMKGMAADIRLQDIKQNKRLFDTIKRMGEVGLIEYRQLIWEMGNDEYPQWVHISYNEDDNKMQILRL